MRRQIDGIIGRRMWGDPGEELQNLYVCKECGQPVDKRDPDAVAHHQESGHQKLPDSEALRLVLLSDQMRSMLGRRKREGDD